MSLDIFVPFSILSNVTILTRLFFKFFCSDFVGIFLPDPFALSINLIDFINSKNSDGIN